MRANQVNAQRREEQQLSQASRRDGSFREGSGGAVGGADGGLSRRRLMTPPPPGAAPQLMGSLPTARWPLPAGAGMPIGCCNHVADGSPAVGVHPSLQARASSSKSQLSRQSSAADASSGVAGGGDPPVPDSI